MQSLPNSRSVLRLVALGSKASVAGRDGEIGEFNVASRGIWTHVPIHRSPIIAHFSPLSPHFPKFGIRDGTERPIWEKSFPRDKLLPFEGKLFHNIAPNSTPNRTRRIWLRILLWVRCSGSGEKRVRASRTKGARRPSGFCHWSALDSRKAPAVRVGNKQRCEGASGWLTDSGFW